MKIQTGYFAALKFYDCALTPVSIARNTLPYIGPILQFPVLAPSRELLKKSRAGMTKDEFEKEFLKELGKHDPRKILSLLPENAVLLCYEKASGNENDWCHRHMVARWLESGTGITVHEAEKTRNEKNGEGGLFDQGLE